MAWRDEWPLMLNGESYDGKNLLTLIRAGKSPFQGVWDVQLLIREIEENLNTQVVDIPFTDKGSNNYVNMSSTLHKNQHGVEANTSQGFHIETQDRRQLVARLARGDVNMPGYDGFPIEVQLPEARFEEAIYDALRKESDIRVSRLLYSRLPSQYPNPRINIPLDLGGRRLFVFQKSEGVNNVWTELSADGKVRSPPTLSGSFTLMLRLGDSSSFLIG
jgi:hypothetical protein